MCGHILLFPQTGYMQPQFTLGISYLLLCNNCHKALKTMHIYYLIVSMGQGSEHGLAHFCTSGSPKNCNQGVSWALVISGLNWQGIHFQAYMVVGRILRFLVTWASPAWQLASSKHGSWEAIEKIWSSTEIALF